MSSFFDFTRPKMLDVKKKINFASVPEKPAAEEQQLVNSNPFITPEAPGMSESWVEIAPSRTSLCSSVDISMVMIDEKDKDSRLSPVSMQSPHVEFENLEQVKYKLVREMLPPGKNTDWIWDWSSRPEHLPSSQKTVRMRQYGSNLTTPPNSPEPELYHYLPYEAESLFNVRVVFGIIVSNLFSFVVGAAVGFVVCRKFAKHREL